MSAEEKNEDDAIKQVVDDDSDDSDDDEEDVLQCKLVVLGDGMVGKTSLIKQFVHGDSAFDKSYCQTIGLNFYSKDLELQGRGKDKRQQVKIRLQLWDIGGQSIGSKMIANYIFNANIVLLVYDGTNQSSFESLEDWYGKVKECQESLEQQVPCVALVGNKKDLSTGHQHWMVTPEMAKEFIKKNVGVKEGEAGPRHFHVSAKTGDNVPNLFYYMAEIFTFGLPGPEDAQKQLKRDMREGRINLKPVRATVTEYDKDDEKQPAIKDSLKQDQCVVS